MAKFEVVVHELKEDPATHANADRLEIVRTAGYESVVEKGTLKRGSPIAYIPEGAILPPWMLEEMGLTGKLAGAAQNRVKAIKLRGVVSRGIAYPLKRAENGGILANGKAVTTGQEIAELIGVHKYVPPIPPELDGEMEPQFEYAVSYDIEDIAKYPDAIQDGEKVRITEKLHGTWCCLGYHPEAGPIVTSKGTSAKGLVFKTQVPEREQNIYVQMWHRYHQTIMDMQLHYAGEEQGLYLIGEIVGPAVPGLKYELSERIWRVFDAKIGARSHGRYLETVELDLLAARGGIATVPVIYEGPMVMSELRRHTKGQTQVNGASQHREGVVVRTIPERRDERMGRVVLKSISEKSLIEDDADGYQ